MSWLHLVPPFTLPSIHKTSFDRDGRIFVYKESDWKALTPIFTELAHAHNERIGPRVVWNQGTTTLTSTA